MFCPQCGSPLPDGAKFCGACGAGLLGSQPCASAEKQDANQTVNLSASQPAAEVVAPRPTSQPAVQTAPSVGARSQGVPDSAAAAQPIDRTQKRSSEERAKNKRRWKIRLIVLAILLVVAVALVLVVLHFDLVDRLIVPYLPAFICDALFW